MSRYLLSEVSRTEVSSIVKDVQHLKLPAFCTPETLDVFTDVAVNWWLVTKGHEPLCLWPICPIDGIGVVPKFTYGFGPVWIREPMGTKALSETLSTYEVFFQHFPNRYKGIEFELYTLDKDVRFFDWYGNFERKALVTISPRYTARIDDIQSKTWEDILRGFSELRRRQLKKFVSFQDLFLPDDYFTFAELLELYNDTLSLQGQTTSIETQQSLKRIYDNLDKECMKSICLRFKETGTLAAVVVLLLNNGTSNLVLNLVSNSYRETGIMTRMVAKSLEYSHELGLNSFDFNGANSPDRAKDKHSYGSILDLLFRVRVDWRTL